MLLGLPVLKTLFQLRPPSVLLITPSGVLAKMFFGAVGSMARAIMYPLSGPRLTQWRSAVVAGVVGITHRVTGTDTLPLLAPADAIVIVPW